MKIIFSTKRRLALGVLFIFLTSNLFSQTGNEFWFAVPEVSWQHYNAGGEPTFVRVSALEFPVTVTLSIPKADQLLFPPIVRNIAAYSTENIDLTPWIRTGYIAGANVGTANDGNIIESGLYAEDGAKMPKGILLEVSGGDVTAYLERNNVNNKDIFALKGKNALGCDFWLAGQNFYRNHNYASIPKTLNAYDIVATHDGTVVTVELPAGKTAARLGWNVPGGTYIINLDRGETFSLVANSETVANHLAGTHVTTNEKHPIAIMWKDDSITNNTNEGYDLVGDQLVPNDLAGTKYIVVRGNLGEGLPTAQKCSEFAFVTTTKPNTMVFFSYFNNISGVTETVSSGYIHLPGTVVRMQLNEFYEDPAKPLIDALYIEATEPVLVTHISGSGFEMGGAVIPRIDGCSGSQSVTINRSSIDPCYLNILTKEAHINDFFITISGTDYPIPPYWFREVPGTSGLSSRWYYLDKASGFNNFSIEHGGIPAIPYGQPTTIHNTSGIFHLGMINGSINGGSKYGYFSDFSENYGSVTFASNDTDYMKFCYPDTIQLDASGGFSYEWEYAGTPFIDGTFIDEKNLSTTRIYPPPGFHTYEVTISRLCYLGSDPDTVISVSLYKYPEMMAIFDTLQIGPDYGRPVEMRYMNNSIGANKFNWTFERVTDTVFDNNQNPDPVYYSNTTNTLKTLKTTLKASYSGNCPVSTNKNILKRPQISASGSVGSSSGCQQSIVRTFTIDTVGAGPITSIYWNWGDGSETEILADDLGTSPFIFNHTFTNLNLFDTTYFVTLVFINDIFGCRDTMTPPYMDTVFVPGVAKARFIIDNEYGYAPHNVSFKNRSRGEVTYEWDFGNGGALGITGNDTVIAYYNNTSSPISYPVILNISKLNDNGT
jgi:hypothetical protein